MSIAGAGVKRLRRAGVAALACGVVSAAGVAVAGPARPYGDARILAQVPTPPGFPEGIAYRANRVYVAGPATFGTAGKPPSAVLSFNTSTGALAGRWDAKGENLAFEHADSSIALDRAGRIYVLNSQLGVYRLSINGRQEAYGAPFPDLPACNAVPPDTPCSPVPFDAPALPNDLAFDRAGNLYVTDSLQATIWKVPAGGGQPQIWFQDVRLAPGPNVGIGVNGLRIDPAGTTVYLTVSEDLNGHAFVYTLPLVAAPTAADLHVFHQYTGSDIPDGIAFGETGLLYVAIATPFASAISILGPSGAEVGRLANPGDPINPYDSPANIAFDGKGSILVTNHAFVTGASDPSRFSVLDVFVNDRGAPLVLPTLR